MPATHPGVRFASCLLAAAALVLATSGCVYHRHYAARPYVGPPPYAPAHGYHQTYDGATLVFVASLASYIVQGLDRHYYHQDHFYRFTDNHWESSVRIGGPWQVVALTAVPNGIRHRHRIVRNDGHGPYYEEVKELRKHQKAVAKERHEMAVEHRKELKATAKQERKDAKALAQQEHQAAKDHRKDEKVAAQQERKDQKALAKQELQAAHDEHKNPKALAQDALEHAKPAAPPASEAPKALVRRAPKAHKAKVQQARKTRKSSSKQKVEKDDADDEEALPANQGD
jgi:hypothetical protein